MSGPRKKPSVSSFFQSTDTASNKRNASSISASTKRRRGAGGSHFGACPLCERRFPHHRLERHASVCNGATTVVARAVVAPPPSKLSNEDRPIVSAIEVSPRRKAPPPSKTLGAHSGQPLDIEATCEPIPGLFLYDDFITAEEEAEIISQLDGTDPRFFATARPWKPSQFNGAHCGMRWGVHCNLRDRRVGAAEHALPPFVTDLLLPKLRRLQFAMKGCTPNEANAIDYRRARGHYLAAHVDDRKLSKEPIANISLAGDCYMTFANVAPHGNTAVMVQRVLLKRRCLQILTGKARYDFTHAIAHNDLLSDRRVSVTMRESPLTRDSMNSIPSDSLGGSQLWWKKVAAPSKNASDNAMIQASLEPIPGLFIFPNFITEEEEAAILRELDGDGGGSDQAWSTERHTGIHRQKRWGVDHDLWSRALRPPKHALPDFMRTVLLPRLRTIAWCMKDCVPNEVNAIEYRRAGGHSLAPHVDDRRKHREAIANLSLAGDCRMTYRKTPQKLRSGEEADDRSHGVLLPRRTLQVLTGPARYDYSHGIAHADLLSERRVSVTMRETPVVVVAQAKIAF